MRTEIPLINQVNLLLLFFVFLFYTILFWLCLTIAVLSKASRSGPRIAENMGQIHLLSDGYAVEQKVSRMRMLGVLTARLLQSCSLFAI